MKILSKSKVSTVALVLVLTIASFATCLLAVNAQPPPPPPPIIGHKETYAFIGAIPNPVGKGQDVLLHVGITDNLETADAAWEGLWVTIEKPDNTTEKRENIRTDSTGGTGVTYTPDQVGTYYLQTHFPKQWYNRSSFDMATMTLITIHMLYEASESEILELVVQEEQVEYYPGLPLPTEYWTRPIDAQLREWSSIAGNWLRHPANKFAPYNDGPETAHILWAKPLTIGGVAGGEMGDHALECGDAYEGKWGGGLWGGAPIILAGKVYYQEGSYDRPRVYHCVDLHTGEELWSKTFLDNRTITFGQLFYWDSYNYHGVFPYLWVTVGGATWFGPPLPEHWYAFDPYTGEWRFTIKNVPSGTNVYGPKGEIYRLHVNLAKGWMALWNASALGSMEGSWGGTVHLQTLDAEAIDPMTGNLTAAAKRAWSWNVTIPTGLPGSVRAVLDDRVIGADITSEEVTVWGLSLEPGKEGKWLFKPKAWTPPSGNLTISWGAQSLEDGVFVLESKETRNHFGFSLDTGDVLWETESEHYMNMYTAWGSTWGAEYLFANIAYGKLFSAGMAGIVYCYNVTTGELLWTYEASDPYQEMLFGNNWPVFQAFITDGKIYLFHSEHSPINPKPRGAPFICLDVETGDEIWRADGLFRGTYWGGMPIIGDSIIALYETYDQRVYAIGKGPSAIEVSASPKVLVNGDSVLIEGMVTDVSPGVEEYALTARFPNGVPAVADEYMSEWMLYVYKQFPAPMDITGVDVLLQARSSNGTITEIGWVTSDGYGCFSCMWTPPDDDVYTIMAIFMGSKSYWASYAQTGLGVGAAPEEPEAPAYNTIDLVIIATVVAVAILVIYTLFTVRKQRK